MILLKSKSIDFSLKYVFFYPATEKNHPVCRSKFLILFLYQVKEELLLKDELIYGHGHMADRTYYIVTGKIV